MTTKLSTIGKWIGAAIATVAIIGTSFLGFHAFNTRAHATAELQSGAQSPQSDSTAQSDPQSGDTPQSAEPTPVDVPKPTPPPHLHREGQSGAQATAQYYLELRAYAINMGDTEWPGLVLWTGCFEGCWLLLVVLCPLARVLVG